MVLVKLDLMHSIICTFFLVLGRGASCYHVFKLCSNQHLLSTYSQVYLYIFLAQFGLNFFICFWVLNDSHSNVGIPVHKWSDIL